MKKKQTIVVPASSGYYEEAVGIAQDLGIDFDTRSMKSRLKVLEAQDMYKHIIIVGDTITMDNIRYSKDELYPKKKNPVHTDSTLIAGEEYVVKADYEAD